jgi:four helix bundle protein
MQHRPSFLVLDLTIAAIERLAPVVVAVRRFDRDLADQIRRAASSVALNIGEGNRSDGGNRRARFCTAAGSNAEVRAALRVAVAWGYVRAEDVAPIDALLDRIAAMLYGLGAR